MLPYMKHKKEASASSSADKLERKPDYEEDVDFVEVLADEMIDAIHKKDKKALAEILRAAFELMDSEPHVEGEHLNDKE